MGSYMGLRSSAALACSASSLFLRHDKDSLMKLQDRRTERVAQQLSELSEATR